MSPGSTLANGIEVVAQEPASWLALGIWYSSLGGAIVIGLIGLGFALWGRRRRLVHALRCGTAACVAQMMGLVLMVAVANPGRWSAWAWLVSFLPFGLALGSIIAASWRGEPRPGRAGETETDADSRSAGAVSMLVEAA